MPKTTPKTMAKYRVIEHHPSLYSVGAGRGDRFDPESDHGTKAEAKARAADLNSGKAQPGDMPPR